MKTTLAMLAVLTLGACASGSPDGGVASYDALKKAHAECAARGGTLALQKDGDPEYIGAYACERK
jgi:uncharacterized lipoprotein YmbA